jgi:1-acyl-sn-glycerol-3-phosphate acyltransferase
MIRGNLLIQYILGRVSVFLLGPLYFAIIRLMGYRVHDLRKIRKDCTDLLKNQDEPYIICANHLTMVDSMILTYAILSLYDHLINYRLIPWNLPERKNFQRNIILTILCYLAKCIPINRGGDRDEMKNTLDKCSRVLETNQALLIFPEGGRSRTGRINIGGFSYGVGRFVKEFENCRVMCIYLRGDHQSTYSTLPRFGEQFTVNVEVFQPEPTEQNGLRAQRHYAEQIIKRLARMEEDYFAARRQRYCGSDRSSQQGKEQEYEIHQPRLHHQ